MPLVQTIAEELNTVSHRVRLACQDLGIEITADDFISDEVYEENAGAIANNVKEQEVEVYAKRGDS
jgi:hypothetical protein